MMGNCTKTAIGGTIAYFVWCKFKTTNNEVKYEALVMGLTTEKELKIKYLDVSWDSLLIVNQVNHNFQHT